MISAETPSLRRGERPEVACKASAEGGLAASISSTPDSATRPNPLIFVAIRDPRSGMRRYAGGAREETAIQGLRTMLERAKSCHKGRLAVLASLKGTC